MIEVKKKKKKKMTSFPDATGNKNAGHKREP